MGWMRCIFLIDWIYSIFTPTIPRHQHDEMQRRPRDRPGVNACPLIVARSCIAACAYLFHVRGEVSYE
jgi:hypothetical protein